VAEISRVRQPEQIWFLREDAAVDSEGGGDDEVVDPVCAVAWRNGNADALDRFVGRQGV